MSHTKICLSTDAVANYPSRIHPTPTYRPSCDTAMLEIRCVCKFSTPIISPVETLHTHTIASRPPVNRRSEQLPRPKHIAVTAPCEDSCSCHRRCTPCRFTSYPFHRSPSRFLHRFPKRQGREGVHRDHQSPLLALPPSNTERRVPTIHISLHPHFLIQHKQPTPNRQRFHFSRENRQKRLCLKSRQFPHLPPFPLLPATTHHAPIVSSNKHDSQGVDRHRSPAGFWKVPRPLFSFAEAPDSAVRGETQEMMCIPFSQ